MSNRTPIWTKSFVANFIATFFVFVIFYAFLTLMPIYILDALEGNSAQAGLVVSVFLLSVILLRPVSGLIIDKFGKKQILLSSILLFGLTTFLYLLTDNVTVLLAIRFFHGIWFSLATTVTGSIAADIIPPERRGEGIGYYGIAMNLAVVGGPFFALLLQPILSYSTIFFLFGAAMLLGFACSLLIKVDEPERLPKEKRRLTFDDLLEKKSFPVAAVGLFVAVAYSSIITFISVYAASLGLIRTASFFFVVYAVAMLIVRPFTGRLFDQKGPNIVIIPSLLFFAAGLYMLSVTESSMMLLLSGAMTGLGYGTLLPSFQTLSIQAAPKHRSAYATATFFMMYDTGIAAGSMILGLAAGIIGYSNLYLALAIAVVLIIFLYQALVGRMHASVRA